MIRNSNRHLDVKSILRLPVYTYEGGAEGKTQKPDSSGSTPEMSWLLVDREAAANADKNPKDQDVCVICLEHFCMGDRLRDLPCGHSFHMGCIGTLSQFAATEMIAFNLTHSFPLHFTKIVGYQALTPSTTALLRAVPRARNDLMLRTVVSSMAVFQVGLLRALAMP